MRTQRTTSMPRRSLESQVIYLAWLVVIVASAFLFAFAAFSISSSLPIEIRRASWMRVALNVITPVLAGLLAGTLAVHILSVRCQLNPTLRAHFFRAAPWYLLICLLLSVSVRNKGVADFGLWSQIVIWPLYSTIGALIADIVLSWRISRTKSSGTTAS